MKVLLCILVVLILSFYIDFGIRIWQALPLDEDNDKIFFYIKKKL